MEQLESVFEFLNRGVSPWHAAAEAAARLEQAGYLRLEESRIWELRAGQGYYVTRNGSAVLAFRVPEGPIEGWRIALSHGDSPTWRIKNTAVEKAGYTKLETEGYGGMLMGTWLDRPLTVAGRVVVRTDRGLETRLAYLDQDLLVIPSVAIHFDRTANSGRKWDPQVDLQPLYGPKDCRRLEELLAQAAGVGKGERVLTWDLCLTTRQKAVRIGPEGEYFMSPRIDDLECAATTLLGFLAGQAPAGILPVWGMLDNEEVGSSSRQGAQGTFLTDVLSRILEGVHASGRVWQMAANSLILSADNGHGVHPNHPELSDPENRPALNGGVVIKVNASQKYTTDAVSAGLFTQICEQAGVPVQRFANRADLPGGSTLGNLQGRSISSPMLDVGLAQLAMHSAVETAGCGDAAHMVKAVAAFYEAELRCVSDGSYEIG